MTARNKKKIMTSTYEKSTCSDKGYHNKYSNVKLTGENFDDVVEWNFYRGFYVEKSNNSTTDILQLLLYLVDDGSSFDEYRFCAKRRLYDAKYNLSKIVVDRDFCEFAGWDVVKENTYQGYDQRDIIRVFYDYVFGNRLVVENRGNANTRGDLDRDDDDKRDQDKRDDDKGIRIKLDKNLNKFTNFYRDILVPETVSFPKFVACLNKPYILA